MDRFDGSRNVLPWTFRLVDWSERRRLGAKSNRTRTNADTKETIKLDSNNR